MERIVYGFYITPGQLGIISKLEKSEFDIGPYRSALYRKLYGVVAFHRETWERNGMRCKRHRNFFIPQENKEAIERARREEYFVKSFPAEYLAVLEFLYRNTKGFQEKYKGLRPIFTATEVGKRIGMKKEEARRELESMVGLLGFMIERYDIHFIAPSWFIPKCRESLIEKLLERKKSVLELRKELPERIRQGEYENSAQLRLFQ